MKKDYKRKLVNGMKKATIYGHELYKNLSEDKKQKLVEYRKKYYKMGKNTLL